MNMTHFTQVAIKFSFENVFTIILLLGFVDFEIFSIDLPKLSELKCLKGG